jgi:carboxypeptidase Q
MMRPRPTAALALCLGLAWSLHAGERERIDHAVNARIRHEARTNSQILRTLHYLTDVHGPRLTGSPNLTRAGEWAVQQMLAWGFDEGRLEPWEFGHPGWLNERLTAHIVAPVKDHLVAEVLAWTPGTNGARRAPAFQLVPPEHATRETLAAYLDGVRREVTGRIVLVGAHQIVPVAINPPPRRRDYEQARAQYHPDPARRPAQGPPAFVRREQPAAEPDRLTPQQINETIDAFLLEQGAVVRVNDAGRDHGQIRAFHNRTFDPSQVVPTVILRNEDYGRITRLMSYGGVRRFVELEFEIVNRMYPEGRIAYNAIADLRGSDMADEVIMLGGHLDSWHAATGATDNAIGAAVMMEAGRILKAIGVRPRRTIRLALWGGEEQGLLGSLAYVEQHFGSFEAPKPAFETFGGYFNVDSGTGRIRGASVFGPPEAADVLRAAFAPFEDLGLMGAISTESRRRGGTDSTSFNAAGLPGISLGQDPIEYGTATWHTNLDTFERVIEEDVIKSATAIAAAVYHLAMRDELLPRFAPEQMPKPAGAPVPTAAAEPAR